VNVDRHKVSLGENTLKDNEQIARQYGPKPPSQTAETGDYLLGKLRKVAGKAKAA
jgi:hypothetical protein